MSTAKVSDSDVGKCLGVSCRRVGPLQQKIGWFDVSIADSVTMALLQYLQSRVDDGSNFNLCEAHPLFQHVLQIPSIADLGDNAQGLLVLHTSVLIDLPDFSE